VKTIRTPFQITGGRVGFTSSQTVSAEQKIVDALVTIPAERLGVYNYGIGVESLVFELADDLVQSDVVMDIKQELADRVSGVTIHDVRFSTSFDESTVVLTVTYSLPLGTAQTLSLTLNTDALNEESPL